MGELRQQVGGRERRFGRFEPLVPSASAGARLGLRLVIDEAVRLAHWFAGPKAPGFVNGVLDTVAREQGLL